MAIKAGDCMLNNWLRHNNENGTWDFQVMRIGQSSVGFWNEKLGSWEIDEKDLQGIPLSESVLLKCPELSYDETEERYSITIGMCDYLIEKQDDWYFIGVISYDENITYFVWNIKYLHKLQNAFTMIGQHLTFKP